MAASLVCQVTIFAVVWYERKIQLEKK